MREWEEERELEAVAIIDRGGEQEFYRVGYAGVTKVQPCEKSGEYSMIPYVRVWRGEAFAEFCQHNIIAVYSKGFLSP